MGRPLLWLPASVVLGAGLLVGAQDAQTSEWSWADAVRAQLARYPLMQAEDLYKLAHQATFGPSHLISDVGSARAYLQQELAGAAASASEPLLEELAGDPELVRVNLRPFKAAGSDPEVLLAALVATANAVRGEPGAMAGRLRAAGRVLEEMGRAEEARRLEALAREMAGKGYPAGHHSRTYTDAYRPAYRVVLRGLLASGTRASSDP